VINERIKTIDVDEKHKFRVIRVENAIIDQLRKIVEGGYSNLYYVLVRDMLEYYQDSIDFKYLHRLVRSLKGKIDDHSKNN